MSELQGAVFEIHIIGEETGELFMGTFRAKEKLSWSDQLAIDRLRRELLGPLGHEADVVTQNRALIISELTFRLTETPEWWKNSRGGLDLIDNNVILIVYEKTKEVREKWIDAQKVKGETARKALAERQEVKK